MEGQTEGGRLQLYNGGVCDLAQASKVRPCQRTAEARHVLEPLPDTRPLRIRYSITADTDPKLRAYLLHSDFDPPLH